MKNKHCNTPRESILNTAKEISEDMQIIQLSTLMELFNRPEKTMFRIFLLLAVLCILISSFGVFFLVSLSTEQRKKK